MARIERIVADDRCAIVLLLIALRKGFGTDLIAARSVSITQTA